MSARSPFYITTAIPYANGAPHIGHAYERIATDAIARFKKLDGLNVLFVTGMDEHGQKMQRTAAKEGLTPQQLADRTAAQFDAMGRRFGRRRTMWCAPRSPATMRPQASYGPGWRRRATFIFPNIRAGIRSATKLFLTRAN